MRYDAVIFDCDGLLIDSEPTWHKVHPAFLAKHGVTLGDEALKASLGRGIKDVIAYHKSHGLEGDTDALAAEFRSMFYDEFLSDGGPILMPGAAEFVQKIAKEGYKIGLATGGHTKEAVEKMLAQVKLREYFSVIVSSDMVDKGKPEPDIFLYTAKQLEVASSQCVVFEDSPNGVLAGKKAGMMVVGVNPLAGLRDELHEAGADIVVPSLLEIDPAALSKAAHV
jgi:HAD superfamily hydrolase (TIGR01509 family)